MCRRHDSIVTGRFREKTPAAGVTMLETLQALDADGIIATSCVM